MNRWREAFRNQRVLNVAHRGARAFAPESTLVAIERAAEFGADAIEIDVHHSRDEYIVVVHDDTLTRCSNVASVFPSTSEYFVSNFSLEQLQSLDAGSWFIEQIKLGSSASETYVQEITESERSELLPPSVCASISIGTRIPTLVECLELARDLNLLVNVEIKSLPRMYPRLAVNVVDTVRQIDCELMVLVSSFDHRQLITVRELSEEMATGVLTGSRIAKPDEYLRLLKADAYHPCCNGDFDSMGLGSIDGTVDRDTVESVQAIGAGVQPWTVNDLSSISKLLDAGVSGIISDFPNRVAAKLLDNSKGWIGLP